MITRFGTICASIVLLVACRSAPAPQAEVDVDPAASSLMRIPQVLEEGLTISFLEMREGDAIAGNVNATGCFFASTWTTFVCTVEGLPGDSDRAWHFRLGHGKGFTPPSEAPRLELVLDTIDILDLEWELQYLRLDACHLHSTSTLEYWLEWWRDGHLISQQHWLDDGGGANHHAGVLTLPRLFAYAELHPEEVRTSAKHANARRLADRYSK